MRFVTPDDRALSNGQLFISILLEVVGTLAGHRFLGVVEDRGILGGSGSLEIARD